MPNYLWNIKNGNQNIKSLIVKRTPDTKVVSKLDFKKKEKWKSSFCFSFSLSQVSDLAASRCSRGTRAGRSLAPPSATSPTFGRFKSSKVQKFKSSKVQALSER